MCGGVFVTGDAGEVQDCALWAFFSGHGIGSRSMKCNIFKKTINLFFFLQMVSTVTGFLLILIQSDLSGRFG